MPTIAYPSSVRTFQQIPSLNGAATDFVNKEGVRISCPLYLDLPTTQRKDLFNGVRTAASKPAVRPTKTVSGLTVESSANSSASVESFLGLSFDNLRNVLFQRGGVPIDLILKLQAVAGLELVSAKDVETALKAKAKLVKDWVQEHTFTPASDV